MEISVSAHLQESCGIGILASFSCSPSGSLVEASSPSPGWVLPLRLILSVRVLLFSTYTCSLTSKYHLPAIYSPVYHLPKTSVPSFRDWQAGTAPNREKLVAFCMCPTGGQGSSAELMWAGFPSCRGWVGLTHALVLVLAHLQAAP